MKLSRRTFIAGAGAAAFAGGAPGRAAGARVTGGPAFGSWWRAALPPDCDFAAARAAIGRVIGAVDAAMSPYRAGSELSRLNRAPPGRWLAVSGDTGRVIAESLRLARLSAGAFDPTVGPLVRRFGFGPIAGSETVDYRAISYDGQSLRKTVPGATLDLCGLAKGFALDRMAGALEAQGLHAFLLEAGGEALARGRHPDGRRWRIGIETPGRAAPAIQRIVALEAGLSLATSGPALQGGTRAGFAFGHIIDARTAGPAAGAVASVSVIAASGLRADALATALVAMGAEDGFRLAEELGLAVLFQMPDGVQNGEVMTKDFARFVVA